MYASPLLFAAVSHGLALLLWGWAFFGLAGLEPTIPLGLGILGAFVLSTAGVWTVSLYVAFRNGLLATYPMFEVSVCIYVVFCAALGVVLTAATSGTAAPALCLVLSPLFAAVVPELLHRYT